MRFPFLSLVGTFLVVLAIVRMAALVLHDPLLGFANQYDMIRTGACIGLYPDLPPDKRDAATPQAPLERYRLGSRHPDACYWGAEALLAGAVVAKHRALDAQPAAFPALRELGVLELVLAAIAMIVFAVALWPWPAAALLHGVTALLVVADPVVTLWMQTLYTEFPVCFGLYLVVATLAAALLREKLTWWLAAAAVAGIVLAAGAKQQFFLLPLVLAAVAAPRLFATSRRELAALAVACAGAIAWHAWMPPSENITQANRANAYLGTILPASTDVRATLANLQLPEKCAAVVGATWYVPRGEDLKSACPEALALPSTAFLRLTIPEPRTLARAVARVTPLTQYPLLGYVGVAAQTQWGTLDAEPIWLRSGIAPAIAFPPARWYLAVVMLACAWLLPAALLWIATLGRGNNAAAHPFAAYLLMLALIVVYALATTVFGDGWNESARHDLPGLLAMVALALATACGLAMLKEIGLAIRIAAAAAAVAAIAVAALATHWALRQPLALGIVDEPAAMEVPRAGFTMKGWALDPAGVAEVRVHGGGRLITIGRESFTPSAKLARMYGEYPDAARANFEAAIPAEWLTQPEAGLRVDAVNARGIVTEIDRRRVRPAP